VNDITSRLRQALHRAETAVVRGLIFLIQLYRHMVSPLRLPTCRFTPTCSQYAVDALAEYGLVRGSWLAAVRLAKCGPWHRGGWDPIPERQGKRVDVGRAQDAPATLGESDSVVV
jgi:putative membrane protein insertion efficiency factor